LIFGKFALGINSFKITVLIPFRWDMDDLVKNLFGYAGKVAVVTGAASGIGRETAKLLVELGANTYGLDVKEINIPNVKYIPVNLLKRDN